MTREAGTPLSHHRHAHRQEVVSRLTGDRHPSFLLLHGNSPLGVFGTQRKGGALPPWLRRVVQSVAEKTADGGSVTITCSLAEGGTATKVVGRRQTLAAVK